MMHDTIHQFKDAIAATDLPAPDIIIDDGRLRRFSSNGKADDTAGWYVFYNGDIPAGAFGCWRLGINQTWRADIGRKLTLTEEIAHKERQAIIQKQREEEKICRHAETSTKAKDLWKKTSPASPENPYLIAKGVKPYGIRERNGSLVIPLRIGNNCHSLQFIYPDGSKRFLTGGRKHGCYFAIGKPDERNTICICEGYSTGASVHEATSLPVAVAFDAGNLLPVGMNIRQLFPRALIVFCADDDFKTEGNPGITKAIEAAKAVSGTVAIPTFWKDREAGMTDFNDMHQSQGLEAVRQCMERAIELSEAYGVGRAA